MFPIKLDMTTDLAKVRANVAAQRKGGCKYSAPCAIGAMLTPEQRAKIKTTIYDETSFDRLVKGNPLHNREVFEVPADQKKDFSYLQNAFDSHDPELFETALKELENKYAG